MLDPEIANNFHKFSDSSQNQKFPADFNMLDISNSKASSTGSSSSWPRRDFSSDEDSHHSFMTSSGMTQSLTSPGMTQSLTSPPRNPPTMHSQLLTDEAAFGQKFENGFDESAIRAYSNLQNSCFSEGKGGNLGLLEPNFAAGDLMMKHFHGAGEMDGAGSEGRDVCCGCNSIILDRFVHQISGSPYHEECLKCFACGRLLTSSCYVRGGKLYCKEDYLRASKICTGCNAQIKDGEMVMRVMPSCHVYHVTCFTCVACHRHLQKGDKYVIKRSEECNNNNDTVGIICQTCWEGDTVASMTSQMTPITTSSAPTLQTEDYDATDGIADALEGEKNNCNLSVPNPAPTSSSPESNDVMDSMMSPKSHSSVMSPKSDDVGDSSEEEEKEVTSHNTSSAKDDSEDKECIDKDDDNDAKRSKRPRTILNAIQRRAFKAAFEMSPKPCRKVREALAAETGLTVRVVQVWFQNQRAKMKKLAKRQQSQEHAAHMKARGQYGYHGYDPMTPLQHQIPPIFQHPDVIADHGGYGGFPNHQQDPGMWERIPGQQAFIPGSHHENGIGYAPHEQMAHIDNLHDSISASRFDGAGIYPPHTLPTSMEQMGGIPTADTLLTTNESRPHIDMHGLAPIMNQHDVGRSIAGLYTMQNNYFEP